MSEKYDVAGSEIKLPPADQVQPLSKAGYLNAFNASAQPAITLAAAPSLPTLKV